MRRFIILLGALLLLGASAALAQGTFPKKIALPNAWAPEGIEVGNGHTVYVGSVGSGGIWVGNLRTGAGRILVEGAPGVRSATGLEFDRGRLWVSGARFGNTIVYNARTGKSITQIQLATGTAPTFINDAVATKKGVYFTDSQRPVIYKVATSGNGRPGAVTTIPLGGRIPARRGPVQPERHRRDGERQDADRRPELLAQAPDDRSEDRRRQADRSRRL